MNALSANIAGVVPEFRAAGTDLSERRRSGVSCGPIVDLGATPGTIGIDWAADGSARIGAFTSIATIASDPRLRDAYPGIAAAAQGLATPQIRHMATLGGNLAQRSRCWYFRNPQVGCLKKGGSDCPARSGNHLYHVAFDLGPCVAPHPSTMAMALLAYDATIVIVADEEVRDQRARARGQVSLDERNARQLSQEEKARRASYVVTNDGSLEELEAKLSVILDKLAL